MKRRSRDNGEKSSVALPLVVLLGAFLASVPAGCNALAFWRRLPQQRVKQLHAAEVQAAFNRVNRNMTAEAREAFALRRASDTLAGALTDVVEPEQLQPTMATAVNGLSKSQVGRLQLAAARMWLLEQAGEPIEKWWPSLRVFLEGMRHANLAHYQAALIQQWAEAYQALGVGSGTACSLAEDLVGHPHGAFLQFLVPRVQRVIQERQQAGDEAAATTCRGVLHSLLKQWVLEPGTAGLQLLAADLLAQSLEANDDADDNEETRAIVNDLRAWRSAYLEAARSRPVATLDPHRKPALAPDAHERLVTRVALVTWLASAVLAAGVVALLFSWSWLRSRNVAPRGHQLALYAIFPALIVIIVGLMWIHLLPDSIREDLRRDFSSMHYWWRHPFVAAGITLALVLAAGLLQRSASGGKSNFPARLGAVAAGTWLVLAVMLWGSAWAGELARRDYERATWIAYKDPVAAMAGRDTERLLTGLRNWKP